jgi:hypothetical protein
VEDLAEKGAMYFSGHFPVYVRRASDLEQRGLRVEIPLNPDPAQGSLFRIMFKKKQ